MYTFLAKNRATATLLFIAYFLALVYFHDAATVAADWLKYKLTLEYYNLAFLASGILISVFTAILLARRLRQHPRRRSLFIMLVITFTAMLAAVLTMTVVNMEAIHFIQYAILAALLLPLTKRYESAFVYATILGIVDEVYQYLVLNPDFSYFDFNDIILNMLGAGAGLLVVALAIAPHVPAHRWTWHSSPAFWFGVSLVLLGIFFSLNISVSFFPSELSQDGNSWFALYRETLPDKFWTHLYGKRYYHILRPWESIIIICTLTLYYSLIDRFVNR